MLGLLLVARSRIELRRYGLVIQFRCVGPRARPEDPELVQVWIFEGGYLAFIDRLIGR